MNYKFNRIDTIKIQKIGQVGNEYFEIDLAKDVWLIRHSGILYTVAWKKFSKGPELETYKGFIASRLETKSPSVITKDMRLLKFFNSCQMSFLDIQIIPDQLKVRIKNLSLDYYSFKSYVQWLNENTSVKIESKLNFDIIELRPKSRKPYHNLESKHYELSKRTQHDLIKHFENKLNYITRFNTKKVQTGLMLMISYELGLRPIQIHALNIADLTIHTHKTERLCSLNILNVKKRSEKEYKKTKRAISIKLGNKIAEYISANKLDHLDPMFFSPRNLVRYSSTKICKLISAEFQEIGINTKDYFGNTILRHNLAQSLANQGSPSEIIASILGHNSTTASNAYVKAVPTISKIKTQALGKSKRFTEIIDMLMTGEPKKEDEVKKDRWVHGVVGNGYIGGIGGCGLPSNNQCPKNPIYSCYTCQKFHPFKDGPHQEVLDKLQAEVQLFIEQATSSGDIQFNRSIDQLELTIESVVRTIERFNK
ncbi:MAG: tyrosine-type recombinase/integrase [Reichenbachiella sp.]|uniref:tyrosine-type recombinase/integrase n=1 Tax=Reichenbachiella sp. TaxID=2184521 RepID=UPI0032975444